MSQQVPIKYVGFWDVPRIFLARHAGLTLLFDCAFDQELDDYPDDYRVYLMPELRDEDLPKDWTTLRERSLRFLGMVPVGRVRFDSSRRKSVDADVLEEVASRDAVAG